MLFLTGLVYYLILKLVPENDLKLYQNVLELTFKTFQMKTLETTRSVATIPKPYNNTDRKPSEKSGSTEGNIGGGVGAWHPRLPWQRSGSAASRVANLLPLPAFFFFSLSRRIFCPPRAARPPRAPRPRRLVYAT